MAHPNQTAVREVTTPTLRAFLTSCLNLIMPKAASKREDVPPSLAHAVFCAFATLLPRYPTLYRPEVSRIRLATRSCLAPTLSDGFVPSSLQESARRLVVLLHLTAVKNTGGDEWGKAVRDIILLVHRTADRVFRAIIEDWESTAGYIGEVADINQDLAGGSDSPDDLPPWTGIYAGVDRVTGLLALLEEYIKGETSTPVSIPLGAIMDMATRVLSVVMPSLSDPTGGLRPHPAIDRDERDGLWSGIPRIHIAALRLIEALVDRLREGFVPLAAGAFDLLTWCFSPGRSDETLQSTSYCLARKLLLLIGKSLNRHQVSKLVPIIRSCCRDLMPSDPYTADLGPPSGTIPKESQAQMLNGHTSLQTRIGLQNGLNIQNSTASSDLLPLFVSHLPQKHLDIQIRSLIERTAILTHHSVAILACIMTPFIRKDGRAISSIMPYAMRETADETIVELLLRPRMPVLPAGLNNTSVREPTAFDPENEDDNFTMYPDSSAEQYVTEGGVSTKVLADIDEKEADVHHENPGFGNDSSSGSPLRPSGFSFNAPDHVLPNIPQPPIQTLFAARQTNAVAAEPPLTLSHPPKGKEYDDIKMGEELSDSSDESVHLNMELDTDSDDQGGMDG